MADQAASQFPYNVWGNSPQTESGTVAIGDLIDELNDVRERKRDLNAQLKDLDEQYKELERQILEHMDAAGTELVASGRTRASVQRQIVPSVTDWEAFEEYVKANDALYLFERRVASKPWRELHESGEQVPGTEPFERRSLSLRKK
ncbi:MAG: hypothetical protein ACOCTG_00305 [Bacteroidota bacterium]